MIKVLAACVIGAALAGGLALVGSSVATSASSAAERVTGSLYNYAGRYRSAAAPRARPPGGPHGGRHRPRPAPAAAVRRPCFLFPLRPLAPPASGEPRG